MDHIPPMPQIDLPPERKWSQVLETYQDLALADLPEPEWFIHNIIPKPGLIAITGTFGSYKTWFTQWMLTRLSAGLALFDKWEGEAWFKDPPSKPVNVLFIEEEMSRRQLKKRITLTKDFGDHKNFYLAVSSGFSLQDAQGIEELKKIVVEKQIDIIALDPFTSVSQMKDENSNAEAAKIMDIIRHDFVDSELECSVIFIHHPSKGENNTKTIRGAGDILGKCDMHFTVEVIEREVNYAKLLVECGKTRYDPIKPFYTELKTDQHDTYQRLEWVFAGIKEDEQEDGVSALDKYRIELIKAHMANNKSRFEVAEMLQMSNTGRGFRRLLEIAQNPDSSLK